MPYAIKYTWFELVAGHIIAPRDEGPYYAIETLADRYYDELQEALNDLLKFTKKHSLIVEDYVLVQVPVKV